MTASKVVTSEADNACATRLTFDAEAACAYLADADPILARLMDRVGPYAPSSTAAPDAFHALVRAIVYQQLSGRAAGTIHRRMLDALDHGNAPGAAVIDAADEGVLRGAGLSAAKTVSLKALAKATLDGILPAENELPAVADAELVERYSQIRGIGRWTAEMLLLFHLGRPDVMPIHDLGVRKGYARVYDLDAMPKPRQLEALCEVWRPYRSVGSWYMWRATEIDIQPAGG